MATPIGNLEDISARALRVLAAVSLVAAEDTRVARKLLDNFGIAARLMSYNDHNKSTRLPRLLAALAEGDVALTTDAGTPAVSDPGAHLVAAAREAGYRVVPVPGASAVVTALSAAGFGTRSFRFTGFLPREAGALRRYLESLAGETDPVVAFEAPSRVRKTLALMTQVLPERRLAVCRELTKMHEEVFVGRAAEAASHFTEPRGEFVLVIEGGSGGAPGAPDGEEGALAEEVAAMKAAGLTRAQAAALLGRRFKASRREIYRAWLER